MNLETITINEIMGLKQPNEIYTLNYHNEFKQLAKRFHPDINKDSLAIEAFKILVGLRDQTEKLIESNQWLDKELYFLSSNHKYHINFTNDFKDEISRVLIGKNTVHIFPDSNKYLHDNFIRIQELLFKYHNKDIKKNLANYLPDFEFGTINNQLALLVKREESIRISDLIVKMGKVPQKHVIWICNRMFEVATYLHTMGISYNAFNPESIYVRPKEHGILLTNFSYSTELGKKLIALPNKHKLLYPQTIFKDKITISTIDISCIKTTALIMLGDSSGNGSKLKLDSEINEGFIKWFQTIEEKPMLDLYTEFRKLTEKLVGPPKFHKLELDI